MNETEGVKRLTVVDCGDLAAQVCYFLTKKCNTIAEQMCVIAITNNTILANSIKGWIGEE